jgi:CHAT domain-containing protein
MAVMPIPRQRALEPKTHNCEMRRPSRFVVAAALLLCACCTRPSARPFQKELAQAEKLRKQQGPEAALLYLNQLAEPSARGDVAVTREYLRLMAVEKLEFALGRFEDAEKGLQKCLLLSAGNPKRVATVQITRFDPLVKMNRLDEAAAALAAAEMFAQTTHNASLEPFRLHYSGLLWEQTGHFEEAVTPLSQSLALAEKSQQRSLAAHIRISLGWAYYHMGQFDRAREEYIKAQAQADPGDQHLSLGHLGNLAYERREFLKAAEFYRKAAQVAEHNDRTNYVRWLVNEATAWIELGEWRKASERNEEAFRAGRELPAMAERQLALVNRARIAAALRSPASAIQQLRTIVAESKEPGPTLDAYAELARIYQHSGEVLKARAAYQAGLAIVDAQRNQLHELENKLSFEASAMKLNQQYTAGLMARGDEAAAFESAEASRARMLRDALNLPTQNAEKGVLARYRAEAKRTGSAYLAYWIAPERSYVWVITPTAFSSYLLPGEADLRGRVDHFQQLIESRQSSALAGAELFRTLVQPALPQLRNVKNIVIVPDGPLYGLNFETLRQGSAQSRYWIEDATLTIAPSLGLMLSSVPTAMPGTRILLMGDASEWSPDFPRLMNASGELDRIGAQFPAGNQTKLTQAKATPAQYEREAQTPYRYIHFATHAAANRSAPLESAIILSQADGRGRLTARDVLRTRLNAELVSISACQSAGARTYAGEGLVGLAWAFLSSGAHSVVAGLWDVSDYSSPLIMGALYSGLAHGETAPEALRNAKLALLKPGGKYAAPYYWGPFLLYVGAGAAHQ